MTSLKVRCAAAQEALENAALQKIGRDMSSLVEKHSEGTNIADTGLTPSPKAQPRVQGTSLVPPG